MPLAWHMPVSSDPPLVAIAIEQSRHTADMISHAQEFAINVPTRPLLHHVQYLGAMRGDEVDKFEATRLETFSASKITAPLLSACCAWAECEVIEVLPLGDHILFVGLVANVQVDPESFGEDGWRIETDEEHRPLHFLGGNRYSTLHRVLEARMPRDFEAPERILQERLEEELELSREARERREERLDALQREVQRGNIVDIDEIELELGPDETLDLSRGHIVRGGEDE